MATIALANGIAAPILAPFGVYALPVAAFLGGAVTTGVLVAVAGRHGQLMVGTLLLAGIAVGALAASLTGLIAYASDDRELRDLTLWMMGSLGGSNWPKVLAVLPFAVLVVVTAPRLIRGLNGFLLGEAEATDRETMEDQANRLLALGPRAVLLKGGHLPGNQSPDVLATRDRLRWFEGVRVLTRNTHGTGCSLSSAIAAELGKGRALPDAVAAAKSYIAGAVRGSDTLTVGSGHGPLHHFHALWD